MNLPELGPIDRFMRIPRILYSSDTRKPFSNCLVCDTYLLEDGKSYMIEKAFKQIPELKHKEVIFEYAICIKCSATLNASLSVESRQRINAYMMANTDLVGRRKALLSKQKSNFQSWISKCVVKGTSLAKAREYQVMAQCDGKHLLFAYMPFAISFEAMDEISELLSEKSRGEIDDFMGKYFTGPPEVSEILKRRIVLV